MRQNRIARRDGRDVLASLQCQLLVMCEEMDAITRCPVIGEWLIWHRDPGSWLFQTAGT